MDRLHFQRMKETLRAGIVVAIAFGTHATAQAVGFEQRLIVMGAVLASPVATR
jgi:hypothetical protein